MLAKIAFLYGGKWTSAMIKKVYFGEFPDEREG